MDLNKFCKENNYTLLDRISYNWDRYENGIVSVTSILKLLYDPGFEFVINNYSDKVKESAEKGTLIHNDGESFFSGQKTKQKLNPNISKFHALFIKEIKGMELRYEKEGVSGTIDLEAIVNIRGNTYLANCDYKNAKVKSPKYLLQMGGYEWLNGNPGVLIYLNNKLELVQVPGIYKDIFVELKDYFFNLLNNDNNNSKENMR